MYRDKGGGVQRRHCRQRKNATRKEWNMLAKNTRQRIIIIIRRSPPPPPWWYYRPTNRSVSSDNLSATMSDRTSSHPSNAASTPFPIPYGRTTAGGASEERGGTTKATMISSTSMGATLFMFSLWILSGSASWRPGRRRSAGGSRGLALFLYRNSPHIGRRRQG